MVVKEPILTICMLGWCSGLEGTDLLIVSYFGRVWWSGERTNF